MAIPAGPLDPRTAKIGFIGIGNMGFPMAGHLVKAGWDVQVYDIDRAKVERFVAEHRAAIDLAFSLEQDSWNGEKYLQLSVADFREPQTGS